MREGPPAEEALCVGRSQHLPGPQTHHRKKLTCPSFPHLLHFSTTEEWGPRELRPGPHAGSSVASMGLSREELGSCGSRRGCGSPGPLFSRRILPQERRLTWVSGLAAMRQSPLPWVLLFTPLWLGSHPVYCSFNRLRWSTALPQSHSPISQKGLHHPSF